jgi:hypothetical protein
MRFACDGVTTAYNRRMQFSRIGRTVSSWMAILAVLVGALAPTLSHALRGDMPDGWVEVCTRLGSKWVSVDVADDAAPAPLSAPSAGLEHCAYCTLNTLDAALPPSSPVLPLLTLQFEVPHLFLAAPRTPFAWQAAQARAPPPLS